MFTLYAIDVSALDVHGTSRASLDRAPRAPGHSTSDGPLRAQGDARGTYNTTTEVTSYGWTMNIAGYRFGRIDIDGRTYTSDVIITPAALHLTS